MTAIIVQAGSITQYENELHKSGRKHPLWAIKHADTQRQPSARKFLEPRMAGR